MFLQDKDLMLRPEPPASTGPKAGFLEAFDAAFDDQAMNMSVFGAEHAFMDLEEKNLELIAELTGEDLRAKPGEARRPFDALGLVTDDANPLSFMTAPAPQHRRAAVENARKVMDRVRELKQQYPEIKTYEEMLEQVQGEAALTQQRAQEVGARTGVAGWFGSLTGGMAGSFTTNDPLNIVSLGLAGGGRTIATRVLSEMGLNSLVESVNQFTGVTSNREQLALRQLTGAEKFQNVLFAGAGAGVLRAAGEGIALGIRKLHAKSAAGEVITDKDIAEALRDMPEDTPAKRAAQMLLDQETAMRDALPFQRTRSAEAVHQVLYKRAYDEINEPFDPTAPQGSRADRAVTDEFLRSRGIDPARVADDAVRELQQTGVPRDLEDARKIATSERETDIRAELIAESSAKLTKGEVAQLRREQKDLTKKIESLDRDFKETARRKNQQKGVTRKKAEQQARQDTEADRQTLEAQLQRVQDNLARHERGAQAEADLSRMDQGQMPKRYAQEIEGRANELLAKAEAFARRSPILDRGYTARETVNSIDEVETKVHDKLDEITDQQFQTAARGMEDESGKVDLGLKEDVDLDMKVKLVDDNGDVVSEVTVRELLEDIKADDALVKAVRECGI